MNTRHFRFQTLLFLAQILMFCQKWRVPACIFLTLSMAPVLAIGAGSMSGADVAFKLGNLTEVNRWNAIAEMARSGQIDSPLSSDDGVIILQGISQGFRANAIADMAPLFKSDLSGKEAEAILGTETILSEDKRWNAISALARAKRFGPSLREDAALALKGTTQGYRANAIGDLAPYLPADLSGQAIATILGSETLLSDHKRRDAIIALTRAGKMRACMSANDMNLILSGMTERLRASAMYEITNAAKPQCVGGGTNPVSTTQSQAPSPITNSFDGLYYNKALRFGFRITGNEGVATVSNSPRYKVGDVMLKFNPTVQSSFAGVQLCTDGRFHPVTGTLRDDGSLDMTIKGCYPARYTMVRSSDAPIPTVGTTPTASTMKNYGDIIGEYRGVIAKSNGDCTGTFLNKCADWLKYAQYQCVDYVKQFYKQNYPMILEVQETWGSAQTFWDRQSYFKLVRYRIGEGAVLPKSGDMLFFDTGHPEGHVAIVTGVSDSQISLIQQNIKRDTAYASISYKQINGVIVIDNGMQFPDGSATRNKMNLLGWLSPSTMVGQVK